MQADQPR